MQENKQKNNKILHQTKSPLTAILGYADLIISEASKKHVNSKNIVTWSTSLKEATKKLEDLLESLQTSHE